MKTKRRRRVDPDKAAAVALGSFYARLPEPIQRQCGEYGEVRSSVDGSGLCGYCRSGIKPTAK